jgi:cytidine deaminase
MDPGRLLQLARDAARQAYAPYSRYSVGAAILAEDGSVYTGCNVENASYGLTICAERVAFFAAVAAGHRRFEAIAVVTPDGGTPCGACRQVLNELAPDLDVLVGRPDGSHRTFGLRELLPEAFGPRS